MEFCFKAETCAEAAEAALTQEQVLETAQQQSNNHIFSLDTHTHTDGRWTAALTSAVCV